MTFPLHRLGDLCALVRGTSATLKTPPGDFPLVVTAEFRRTADTWQIEGPAVCVPLISSTGHGDAALHRVHYQEGRFALANLLVALLPKISAPVDAKYLYRYLLAKKDELFVPLMLGTANVSLKERDIADVVIPLPPLPEQQRIVARIEAMALEVSRAQANRHASDLATEALLTAAISARFVDQTLWQSLSHAVMPTKDAVRSGPFGSQLLHEEFTHSGVAAIGTRDVQTDQFQLTSGWFVSPAKFESFRRYKVHPGDLLCTIVGASIGRFCVVPPGVPDAFTTKHIQALTLNPELALGRFCSLMLNFHRRSRASLFSQVEGSAQPSLNSAKVLATEIPLPSLEVQERAVEEIDRLQAEVRALRQAQSRLRTELDALLPAILDRAFAGAL